ncbi:MAG: S24/S26 family peptidase [Candidatus Omnitrophica bacterium]|nr:S24/S26 family peptidase [Candidatus Omnitrophota bacterium]MCM8771103.1 S24/S26 family peptidase [Candidatus Omnitrophota bacterium]
MLKVRVKGKSMRPFLSEGDILFISPVGPAGVSKGDIVVYSENNNFVCHRIFKIQGSHLLIKPDTGIKPEATLSFEQLIGRVVAVEKKGIIFRLDNFIGRLFNIFISYFSLITAYMYIILGKLRNV